MFAVVQGNLQMGRKDLAELEICQAQSASLLFHGLVSRDWSSSHGRLLLLVLLCFAVGNNLIPSFSLLLEMHLEAVFRTSAEMTGLSSLFCFLKSRLINTLEHQFSLPEWDWDLSWDFFTTAFQILAKGSAETRVIFNHSKSEKYFWRNQIIHPVS